MRSRCLSQLPVLLFYLCPSCNKEDVLIQNNNFLVCHNCQSKFLYENKKVIRGNFIENSSYEAFLAADELGYLSEFLEKYTTKEKREIEILPANDPLAEYWSSADSCY